MDNWEKNFQGKGWRKYKSYRKQELEIHENVLVSSLNNVKCPLQKKAKTSVKVDALEI